FDADAMLEETAGKSIRQIFADEGEPAFRDLEARVFARLANTKDTIIATGGGVVLRPENREELKRGPVVWLVAPAEVLWQRVQVDPLTTEQRPNLAQGGLDEIQLLLADREPLYRQSADIVVDTSTDAPDSIAELIVRSLTSASPVLS